MVASWKTATNIVQVSSIRAFCSVGHNFKSSSDDIVWVSVSTFMRNTQKKKWKKKK